MAIAYFPKFKQAFPSPKKAGLTKPKLLKLYAEMLRIRKAEEKVVELYPQQEMRCPTHLSIGQEATPVGICANLTDADHVYSGHRCHAHYLAKSGTLEGMFAELYGKVTGCAHGMGGSMHLVQPSTGMMGSSAIVGGTVSTAAGSALAFHLQKRKNVAVTFFGDAGTEGGTVYETAMFAVLKKLPVLFVCENNYLATNTPVYKRQPNSIAARFKGMGIPSVEVDGNNVIAVYVAAKEAVARARAGKGPTFFECHTYRPLEHVGYNYDYQLGHRTKKEVDAWLAYDPIKIYKNWLIKSRVCGEADLKLIEDELTAQISQAVARAKEAPLPTAELMKAGLYA